MALPNIAELGMTWGWCRGTGDWAGVQAAIDRNAPVQVIQEAGSTQWQAGLPPQHPFQFGFPKHTVETQPPSDSPAARIWISPIQRQFGPASIPKVQWHPRVLWVGIGCERGTPLRVIDVGIQHVLQAYHLAAGAVAGVATIASKADEVGLVTYCADRHLPFRCFTTDQLSAVTVPHPSAVVGAAVGTPSVAEAAALLSSQLQSSQLENIDAIGESNTQPPRLQVPKQVFRLEGEPGSVTIAIAQAIQEYAE